MLVKIECYSHRFSVWLEDLDNVHCDIYLQFNFHFTIATTRAQRYNNAVARSVSKTTLPNQRLQRENRSKVH